MPTHDGPFLLDARTAATGFRPAEAREIVCRSGRWQTKQPRAADSQARPARQSAGTSLAAVAEHRRPRVYHQCAAEMKRQAFLDRPFPRRFGRRAIPIGQIDSGANKSKGFAPSLAGLRTCGRRDPKRVTPTGRRFPAHTGQCFLTAFVSAHRCGAVPDLNRSSLFCGPKTGADQRYPQSIVAPVSVNPAGDVKDSFAVLKSPGTQRTKLV